MHVKPIEAAQCRAGPGLAADGKTAATVSSDQPPYETDVVLRDGSTLRLRPVRWDDREGLLALHDRLSRESLRSRFFGIPSSADDEVSRLLRADQKNEFVLVAEVGKRVVGVATYIRDPKAAGRAEVAFAIADTLQGRGLGTRMLETLAGIARDHASRRSMRTSCPITNG